MTCPSAGLVFIGCICTTTPTVLPRRLCAWFLHLFPSTHIWAAQTLLPVLPQSSCSRPLFPQLLRRHQEQFSTVQPPHWVRESPSMQRCVALASLDSLPAEWSLAQWPITPSKALRGAHRTLAPMSSVAQLVLLTHDHSSGRPQQMEGKALQSEDPGSHMWPWLGWWWFRCLALWWKSPETQE